MEKQYSFIGPDVFMDKVGRFHKRNEDDEIKPIIDKYTEAEDRFVDKHLNERKDG